MNTEPITSELPRFHWSVIGQCFAEDDDRFVLDLGCGWHDEADREKFGFCGSTPGYFLDHGCFVIGVDSNESHVVALREEYGGGFIAASVSEPLVALLMQCASYIKCDVEGAEAELFRVPIMQHIRGVAVECHDENLLAECRRWCRDGGLTIIAEQPLAAHPSIVVVTAVREVE